MSPDDALAIMNLAQGASTQEIQSAFRKLAKQTHPDLFLDPVPRARAEERFKVLKAAVDRLAQGYTVSAHDGTETARGRPFDPQAVYGSTYGYSFARRDPLAHNPLVACFLAFALVMAVGVAFENYGVTGVAYVVAALGLMALLVFGISRVLRAIRRSLGNCR